MKAFDLLVLLALLITAYGGFKNGFIQTVFKTIGYIAVGDSTTLADPNVMKLISEGLNSGKSED